MPLHQYLPPLSEWWLSVYGSLHLLGQDLCVHSIHIFGQQMLHAWVDSELLWDSILWQEKKMESALNRQRYRHQKWIKLTETCPRMHVCAIELFFFFSTKSLLHANWLRIYLNNSQPSYKADVCTLTTETAPPTAQTNTPHDHLRA